MALSNRFSPAALLKTAAAAFAIAGLGFAAWLVDKAIRYPEIRARQFGHVAPLWVPFALFICLGVGGVVALFLRAAWRVEAGEDLFEKRHRRRRGEPAEQEQGRG